MGIDQLFKDDELRHELAVSGDLKELQLTYKKKREFINKNTGEFWDKKFKVEENAIDYMEEDRIKVAEELIPKDAEKILNIGVGRGKLEERSLKLNPHREIYGIDITKETILSLRKKIKGNFKKGSIYNIPFIRKFDAVIVLEVLEHLPPNKVFKAYKEIGKKMKNNARVIFSVPINENYSSKFNPNAHLRRYTKELFISEIKIAGFKPLREMELYAFEKHYQIKKFLANTLLKKRWKPNVIVILAKK